MDDTRDLASLATGAVRVDLSKDLIVATGADRVRFLHGIVTGDVAGTPVGGGCQSALLTAKAHVVAEMRIFVREQDLYLVVAAGQGAPTTEALARYAIMDDFAAAPAADFAFLGLLGPEAAARLAAAGWPVGALASAPAWSHADVAGAAGPLWVVRVRQLGAEGLWLGGPRPVVEEAGRRLAGAGVPRLDPAAAEAARIAAGEPVWGREISEEYFPMEVGLDAAIDYTKGCYLGQEPVVRIRDRGHINWRLVRLQAVGDWPGDVAAAAGAGPRLPSPGDRLQTAAKPKAGKVTSVARLPDGLGVALALAHVSVPAGAEVDIVAADGAKIASARVLEAGGA